VTKSAGFPARPLLFALAAGHACLSLWPALFEIRNDFANYYLPARMVVEGRPLARLYERDFFQAEARRAGLAQLGSFVPQPPANALLLVPLGGLAPVPAKAAWTLVLAAAYAAALPVLRSATGLPWPVVALVLLLPTSSLANALAYGQPYPLLLLLLSLSLLLLLRGREFLGGLLLAPVLLLKLYAVPHVLFLVLGRRWRALPGLAAGLALSLALSVAVLGGELHATYLSEILPRSLAGEIQDPHSPLWGSFASLTRRLFQTEPDLNPSPALDAPGLAAPLARGAAALALLLSLTARASQRRQWAALTLAALLASPLTQSYHFVLLALPVALLVSEPGSLGRRLLLLGLLVFATSPLPHYSLPLAHGWGNLLAYPRLLAVAALLALALRGALSRTRALASAAVACAAALTAPPFAPDPAWQRIEGARGYLAAEPVACEGGIAWVEIERDRYVLRHSDGRVLRGEGDLLSPRCVDGRLASRPLQDDSDRDARGIVSVDVSGGALFVEDGSGIARPLATGRFRRPRLSPDGRLVAAQSWEDGSWDIRVIDRDSGASRRVTRQPSNEVEPSFSADGASLLFASDWRRGLGSTAIYRLALR
jgi:alpha-1,2-mannosyltransferase